MSIKNPCISVYGPVGISKIFLETGIKILLCMSHTVIFSSAFLYLNLNLHEYFVPNYSRKGYCSLVFCFISNKEI